MKLCHGWRYNMKKKDNFGEEICINRDKCKLYRLYNKNTLSRTIGFRFIKDFRKCDKYKTKS